MSLPNGTSLPLTHWENILGRSKTADIYLNYPSISRQHAAPAGAKMRTGRCTTWGPRAARR
ncbi:MAG: FHA domain-containing protein [Dysosmobacter welbionis]